MNIFMLSAMLAMLAWVLGIEAFRAKRLQQVSRYRKRAAVAGTVLLLTAASIWLGLSWPSTLFPLTPFGPGWECTTTGSGGSEVCWRDVPPALQGQQPEAGSQREP